ncbi:MAG: hypothetical protein H6813_05620 [Phycisphaeraceae bacterium]|nr:hypothetical protein [Phycisphaeraceae bacterium]MCB9847946.1 hypothetical protein [Phycisphaeraceae bacterium]
MDWALRAAMALLGVSALWLLVVLLRPLSHGRSPEPATIPTIAEIANHPASIDERQARLAALNRGGNLFATDRRNWPVIATTTQAGGEAPAPDQPRQAQQQPVAIAAGDRALGDLEITRDVSTAIQKRLDLLRLRGVYRINGQAAAMIGQRTNSDSETYRVGDTFADGEWRLEAIDAESDRVILSRSGQNFELTLYDTGTMRSGAAAPLPSISATNAPGDVTIDFTSLDKVATELRDAGLPRDEINELIALSREPAADNAGSPDPAVTADDGRPKPAIPPAMPPGMVQLFKAMAEGSRDVVAPTPEPKPADATPEKAADKAAEDAPKKPETEKK